ncbi:MAG TPA: hypothetical protein DCP91_00025 [Eggerthellaceae bacterium]|nr:hypothetical protein [Eggerthellaceae bacterium]
MPWARIEGERTWAPGLISDMREQGFTAVVLALRDPRLRKAERLALVLGTEGNGLATAPSRPVTAPSAFPWPTEWIR